ncbi:HET-domain-containing protein [Apiospora arundinis]
MSFPVAPDFKATPGVPLIDDKTSAIMRTLSWGYMSKLRRDVIDRARQQTYWNFSIDDDTSMAFDYTAQMALQRMPPKLIAGILLGTTAFQANLPPDHPLFLGPDLCPGDAPNIYVATIVVKGRKGAWLNGNELNQLLKKLELYHEALEDYEARKGKANPAALTDHQMKLIKFVNRIDGSSWTASAPLTKFPTDYNTPLIQAPCYVGVASNAAFNTGDPKVPTRKNWLWWLTMSCMWDMHLEPAIAKVKVTGAWQSQNFSSSEMVVGALAGTVLKDANYNLFKNRARSKLWEPSTYRPKGYDLEGQLQRARYKWNEASKLISVANEQQAERAVEIKERAKEVNNLEKLLGKLQETMKGDAGEQEIMKVEILKARMENAIEGLQKWLHREP